MSKNTGLLRMTGKIGEYVGYYRNGKQYFRTMPKQVRRSKATQLSAIDFGTASKAGKLIRQGLRAELNIRHDDGMINRLNADMLRVLYAGSKQRGSRRFQRNKLSMLTGMRFNERTELSHLLSFSPKVVQDRNSLRITIPALGANNIRHARNTTHIEIKVIALGVNFNEGACQEAASDKVLIDFSKPAAAAELVLPFNAGDEETIVVLQVRAFSEEGGKLYALGNRKYFAADIIDIVPSLPATSTDIIYYDQPELKPVTQLPEAVHYVQLE
ncbi:hypothetical protein [Chitinophaga niabensis]|uniref:Uncharacterized protein n=1 Tax=Chitinophaga niabensis TaxID=536979 RepID=A0A1N6D906_9BACT|nr:hypothetical protein [Chitinophaga niabensis]SIN67173.1 hypothetical protein SAMN04488055_0466 [Chitinophaga niabensis]